MTKVSDVGKSMPENLPRVIRGIIRGKEDVIMGHDRGSCMQNVLHGNEQDDLVTRDVVKNVGSIVVCIEIDSLRVMGQIKVVIMDYPGMLPYYFVNVHMVLLKDDVLRGGTVLQIIVIVIALEVYLLDFLIGAQIGVN